MIKKLIGQHIAVAMILFAFMLAPFSQMCATAAPIGSWKAYMAYSDITGIVKTGNRVYVLASDDLYMYDTSDQSITTFDKNNGLSDSYIAFIAWSDVAKRLIIVYANGNIDLLDANGNIVNVSDYYNKQLTSDKTVNNVCIVGDKAYLATGFGIVTVNIANATVTDSYNLGTSINDVAVNNSTIYAATANNILRSDLRQNPTDPNTWSVLANEGFKWLYWKDSSLVGVKSLNISTIDTDGNVKKQSSPYVGNCTMQNNIIFCLGGDDTYMYRSASERGLLKTSLQAIAFDSSNNSYWMNNTDGTLCNAIIADDYTYGVGTTGIRPDGPNYNYFGFMMFHNNKLYTCGGQGNSSRPACVQVMSGDNEWNVFDESFAKNINAKYRSAYSLAIDPADEQHVYVGAQSGLFEFKNGEFSTLWNMNNSPLWYANGVKSNNSSWLNYNKVTTMTTTSDGTLWLFNSETTNNKASLLSLKGTEWTDHGSSEFSTSAGYSFGYAKDMFVDSRGLIWFCNQHSTTSALACYQPSNGGVKVYKNFVNQDGTSYTLYYVSCVTEDKEGNIWIGTDVGPFMLPASQIGTDDNTFTQVKIPRNDGTNLADYLLSNVPISCIYVDGAGRKWFGTAGSGVYLVSADNIEQLQNFTRSNSQLLSNDIESITCNELTGEVFFGTSNGLCSYMSDATTPVENMTKDNVYAYPNPVRPDYTGLITVTGLSLDADVKIVTTNGTLVAEGRSNGGTFTWDGNDQRGKRVASGIYMVETATASGGKGTVCKIAVIN